VRDRNRDQFFNLLGKGAVSHHGTVEFFESGEMFWGYLTKSFIFRPIRFEVEMFWHETFLWLESLKTSRRQLYTTQVVG